MNSVFVALMDNGSDDQIIHGIHASRADALAQLQRDFLKWKVEENEGYESLEEDAEEMLETFADPDHPTLEEMDAYVSGSGVQIVEVKLGADLYVELRDTFEVDEEPDEQADVA